jgi:hypothetical protein
LYNLSRYAGVTMSQAKGIVRGEILSDPEAYRRGIEGPLARPKLGDSRRIAPKLAQILSFTGSRNPSASPISLCFSIPAILAIMAILAIFPLPYPSPYGHPFPPKVTQSTQEPAEGRDLKMTKRNGV